MKASSALALTLLLTGARIFSPMPRALAAPPVEEGSLTGRSIGIPPNGGETKPSPTSVKPGSISSLHSPGTVFEIDPIPTIERLANSAGAEKLLRFVQGLPDEAFSPVVRSAIEVSLANLGEPPGPECAAAIASILVAKAPDDIRTRKVVARAWMLGGLLDKALVELSRWQSETPDDSDWMRLRAEAYILAGQPELAVGVLGKRPLETRLAWLRWVLGVVVKDSSGSPRDFVNGETSGVRPPVDPGLIEVFESIEKVPRETATKQLSSAVRRLLDERLFVDAALALQALRRFGGWGDAEQFALSELFKGIRDFDRELGVLAQLEAKVVRGVHLDNRMSDSGLFFRIGRATFHTGQLVEADRLFFLARTLGKNDPEMCYHMAKLRNQQRRPEEAIAFLKKAAASTKVDKYVQLSREQLASQPASR